MTTIPLVAIKCTVYNHEPYLRECLDGFVMQQTDFPFVAIVHDDASTDHSADIIREYAEKYPDIIHPIYETENQYSRGTLSQVMNDAADATGAKYIALCEGDDYWTDPKKLQKQVEILEKDNSLMAVVTDTSIVDAQSNVLCAKRGGVVKNNKRGGYNLYDFFGTPQHAYPTATVVYRNTHQQEIRRMMAHTANPYLGDWTLWIILHTFGDFYYIDEVTAAYRINPTSVTHTCNRVGRAKANRTICHAVADILPPQYADISRRLRKTNWVWVSLVLAYKAEHKYLQMIGAMCVAMLACPKQLFKLFYNSLRSKLTHQAKRPY